MGENSVQKLRDDDISNWKGTTPFPTEVWHQSKDTPSFASHWMDTGCHFVTAPNLRLNSLYHLVIRTSQYRLIWHTEGIWWANSILKKSWTEMWLNKINGQRLSGFKEDFWVPLSTHVVPYTTVPENQVKRLHRHNYCRNKIGIFLDTWVLFFQFPKGNKDAPALKGTLQTWLLFKYFLLPR